jgi:serine/threonine protein kinase
VRARPRPARTYQPLTPPRPHCRWLGKHGNIISLKDLIVDLEEDTLYVCMELMDTDLHKVIQSQQALTDAHYKHFMFQLLLGLRFAHRYGIIHRDLKPANLLVTKACDLVISDFGLARQVPTGTAGGSTLMVSSSSRVWWARSGPHISRPPHPSPLHRARRRST